MTCKKKPLTVKELIELLAAQPPDALVWLDGDDCASPAVGVKLWAARAPPYVLIE
jgi:hypothetical protein